MKDFKGTKGMWKTEVFDRHPWSEGINISGEDYDIALMVGNLKDLPDEEIEEIKANARAISAVPEMISSLAKLIDLQEQKMLHGKFEGYLEERQKAWEDAKEALKKALG